MAKEECSIILPFSQVQLLLNSVQQVPALMLQRFRPLPMGMDFLLLNLQKYRKLLMAVCLFSLLLAMVTIALSILL